jgi:hypothetical protein
MFYLHLEDQGITLLEHLQIALFPSLLFYFFVIAL